MTRDAVYLNQAARHALRGAGCVEPNPLVGAVIVRNGRVLGVGHHRRFGGPHAEIDAISSCRRQGNDPAGATLYVTLEPCNAPGKQPACVDGVIAAKIARVVYAIADPNPAKAGGANRLRAHGITAEVCDESELARELTVPFFRRMGSQLPWVIAKWAQTIDGRIATRTGDSKWISNDRSRARVHRLRGRVDAILSGIGTVIADDPLLNARTIAAERGIGPRRRAVRVIADTDLDIPLESQIVQTARQFPTIVACDADIAASSISAAKRATLQYAGVTILPSTPAGNHRGLDLTSLLRSLANVHGLWHIMTEAGPGLLGSLFEQDLVDEAWVYVAPMLLGDEMARSVAVGRIAETLTNARRYRLLRVKQIESDVELMYRRR
jgi:diaminohydroxyphosphoribosylaminopyrimidine deaminase / 5-amino-6-(5-phosphoribosylamino)uracil reductase